jgi:hypothetical protein
MPDEHALKISIANKGRHIANRLLDSFDGKVELSANQVKIGLGFLAKLIPDMAAITHTDSTPITMRTIVIDVSGEDVASPLLPSHDESDTSH